MGTASYQVEGAYREDGRGASIWDTFTGANTVGMPGANCSYCCKKAPCKPHDLMIKKGATGNVAADHYHRWQADIALMKSMGLKHYRFSISWPRLVPTGNISEGVNSKGIAFYSKLIDGLLAAGIKPMVTLYHWDLPQGLLDPPKKQGWWSRDALTGRPNGQVLPHWLEYVRLCFREFGDRVKTWVTFNEPWTFIFLGSGLGKAPSHPELSDLDRDPWIAGHNVLNAHAAAVDVYRREFKLVQLGQIGIINNCDWKEPASNDPQDIAAAQRGLEFTLGWFADPIWSLATDYPPAMRQLYGSRLPVFTPQEQVLLRGSSDFFGLNHYGTAFASYAKAAPGADFTFAMLSHRDLPQAQSSWLFSAGWGLRKTLNWISKRYAHPPIYVTEGGWSIAADTAAEAAGDSDRAFYYANYTSELLKAVRLDNVNVRGYYAWSLLDNFEWEKGYDERFGMVFTDFGFGRDPNAPRPPGEQDGEDEVGGEEGRRLADPKYTVQPTQGEQWRRRKESSCWFEAVRTTNALIHPSQSKCVHMSVFNGHFQDVNQAGCTWKVEVGNQPAGRMGSTALLIGSARCFHNLTQQRAVEGMIDGGSIVADLSAAGMPPRLAGFWSAPRGGIEWAGGMFWKAIAEVAA